MSSLLVKSRPGSGGVSMVQVTGVEHDLISKPVISCTKPVGVLSPHSMGRENASLPCDFDHMYSSLSQTKSVKDSSEIRQLKELLSRYLELIQEQSEQIKSKDARLEELEKENQEVSYFIFTKSQLLSNEGEHLSMAAARPDLLM